MAYPVVALTKPRVLNGQNNGRLDAGILHRTPGQAGGPEVRLVEPATRAWRALSAAAKRAGHTLKATSLVDSYRPYDIQERIFRQRFQTSPTSTGVRRTWQGRTWWLKPGYALAAVPGTSNHGWGLAVDVGEESDGDTGTESLDGPTLTWLLRNEGTYGFSHEVQSEPWHIRYFPGDKIPAAVLAHERGQTTTTEDDEMNKQEHDALLGTRFLVEALFNTLNPNGVTSTKEGVKGTKAKAVADIWRWQREDILATRQVVPLVAQMSGQIAGLTAAVKALSGAAGAKIDTDALLAAVAQAAEEGARDALSSATVDLTGHLTIDDMAAGAEAAAAGL